jgi:hypothetical protein
MVLGVLGIFIAATGLISLALHNLKQGLRNDMLRTEMTPRRRSPLRQVQSGRQ